MGSIYVDHEQIDNLISLLKNKVYFYIVIETSHGLIAYHIIKYIHPDNIQMLIIQTTLANRNDKFCPTQWSCRANNIEVPEILATLKEFENDDDANVLYHNIRQYDIILAVVTFLAFLQNCKTASEYMQKEDLDLVTAMNSVVKLKMKKRYGNR